MTLLHPWWLLPAAMFIVAYVLLRTYNSNDWRRVIHAPVLDFLQRGHHAASHRHLTLLLAAITCVALSGPSIETQDSKTFQHTQGWIVLADVSRSMTLTDTIPTRLAAMKNIALELADRANANSITLIIYAGDSFVIAPPSFDTTHFKSNVNLLEYGTVPMDGSNLTRAFSLAWSVIDGSGLVNARLFVLSDTGGFNTRSDAAIARLASLGHRIDIILIGNENSGNAAPFDIKMANSLAASGNGVLLQTDAIGNVNLSTLGLDKINTQTEFITQSGITTLRWSNQSHWLLLLMLPLVLLAFHRELK